MHLGIILVLSCVSFSAVYGRSVSDNSKSIEDIDSVLSLFEVINENMKRLGDSVSKSFDAAKLEEAGRNIAKNLDEWGADIKQETENLKDNEAVKNLRETVDQVIEDMKKSPDVKAAFEKFKSESDVFLNKVNEVRKAEEPKLKELSKKVLDQTTIALQEIAKAFQGDVKKP